MKIYRTLEISSLIDLTKEWMNQFIDVLQKNHRRIAYVLNGHISFGNPSIDNSDQPKGLDNIDGAWVLNAVSPGASHTDFTITHNLNRVPIGYFIVRNNKDAIIFDGTALGADWTSTTMVLRSSQANTTITLFVI